MLTEEKHGITSDQVMGQGVKTTLGISSNEFALSDKVCSNRSDIIQTQLTAACQGFHLQQS